jgi:hypothetical protein
MVIGSALPISTARFRNLTLACQLDPPLSRGLQRAPDPCTMRSFPAKESHVVPYAGDIGS